MYLHVFFENNFIKLSSTISRGAGQAFAEMYVALGKAMELDLDKVVALLLLKAADTNKFIR